MLLDVDIFKHIPQPWFGMRWAPEKKDFVGEDWFFCENLERAGYHIYIDHGLSREIGHVGELEFTHEFCQAEQRLVQALGVSPRFVQHMENMASFNPDKMEPLNARI